MDMTAVPAEVDRETSDKTALLGMLLISAGAMVVEIALTRVFSLALYYHYAFLVVGMAMLGLGEVGGLPGGCCARHSNGPREAALPAT